MWRVCGRLFGFPIEVLEVTGMTLFNTGGINDRTRIVQAKAVQSQRA